MEKIVSNRSMGYGGSVIRQYLNNKNLKKIIESALAILLIGTAFSVFFYNP